MNIGSRKWLVLALFIKILFSIISIYAYPSTRLLILVIMTIWFFIDMIVYRKAIKLFVDILVICSIIIVAFPCYRYLEESRFSSFGNMYISKVADVLEDLNELPDTNWGKYNENTVYVKHGNSILIYFPTNVTNGSGYVYFSDLTARDFWEHPSKYYKQGPDKKSYIELQNLRAHWAYVVIFK